ncbi:uncharacterized protein sprt [Planococcus citri]|uniref:uncharacterized protein sprt n=1 Tax=Planococcus citri TaxID=170843 RepID=UPI0031F8D8E1
MDTSRPKSHTGDYSIKRRFGKGFRNSKKNIMIFSSNKNEDSINESFETYMNATPHRSCSLNALHTGQVLLQPRMAQLETLEAKMARIENSLSTTPRKKKISTSNTSVNSTLTTANINLSNVDDDNILQLPKDSTVNSFSAYSKSPQKNDSTSIYHTSKDIAREMDALKNALKDKEHVIDSLRGQLNSSLNSNKFSTTYFQSKQKNEHSARDRKMAEEKLERLNHEMENKTLLIKNIRVELERLDITDNIDIRIQQAELEYQLGREELNLLGILEESQSLKACLEECDTTTLQKENVTLFNFLQNESSVSVHAIEIVYDPKSPRFGGKVSEDGDGLYVEWSAENSGLMKGDRLLEINGKNTFNLKNRDDMVRLLSVSPNPAQIVVLRCNSKKDQFSVSVLQEELDAYREKAGEAERLRDTFRSDNLRLTHRISYLEEQVSELLSKVSRDETRSTKDSTDYILKTHKPPESQVQIFQKGSKVTVIGNADSNKNSLKRIHDLPIIYNKLHHKNETKPTEDEVIKNGKNYTDTNNYHRENNAVHLCITQSSRDNSPQIYTNDVSKKTNDLTTRLNLKYYPELNSPRHHHHHLNVINISGSNCESSKNKENYYNLMNEKKIKYIKESQNSLFNNSNRTSGETGRRHFRDDRSCKSVDFDSEPNYQSLKNMCNGRSKMYDSETSSDYVRTIKYPRPIPPQKPLRLSLHKGCSLQSVKIVDKSSDLSSSKKNFKKSHKSELCINPSSVDSIDRYSSDNKGKSIGY